MKNHFTPIIKIIVYSLSVSWAALSYTQTFYPLTPPTTANGFKSVWCGMGTNTNLVFIHEPSGIAYKSVDGGYSWSECGCGPSALTNNCDCNTNSCYNGICFSKTNASYNGVGFAVGDAGTIKVTFNNGESWIYPHLLGCIWPPNCVSVPNDFYACSLYDFGSGPSSFVEIVGSNGIVYYGKVYNPGPCDDFSIGSISYDIINPNYNLNWIHNMVYCGDHGILGHILSPNTVINTGTSENLYGLYCTDPWQTGSTIVAVGANGTILHFTYNGSQFINDQVTLPSSLSSYSLYSVSRTIDGKYYAVGDQGLIVESLDGLQWFYNITPTLGSATLRGIDINEHAIYIVGENLTILKADI
jgi:hypothetical protein